MLEKPLDKVKRLILGATGSSCEFLFKRWTHSGDSVIYSITLTRRPAAISAVDGPAGNPRRSQLPSPPSPQCDPPVLALPADGWPQLSASAPSTPEAQAKTGRAKKTEGGLGIVFKVGESPSGITRNSQNSAGHAWPAGKASGPRRAFAWPAGQTLRATRVPQGKLCGPRRALAWPAQKALRATHPQRVASEHSFLRSHGNFGVSCLYGCIYGPRFPVF